MLYLKPEVLEVHEDDEKLALMSIYYFGELYIISWNKVFEEADLFGMVGVGKVPEQKDMDIIASLCKDYFYNLET